MVLSVKALAAESDATVVDFPKGEVLEFTP